ncbi:hypothetical protein ABPG72_004393 [Tetrahymena utriculariae]
MSDYNEQEKTMLIESMAKLIEHIHDSKVHQTEIFNSLTTNDLLKILSNIEDKNLKLRKTSCRFLCELLYDNNQVQDLFCELTGVLPIDGKVCVNKIPESFNQHMRFIPEILEIVKNSSIPVNDNGKAPLCWYFSSKIDYNQPFRVQFFFPQDQNNFDSSEFIDPQESIFGFVINSPFKQKRPENYSKGCSIIQDISKYSIEKDSYKSQHNNQASLNSSRVSPIKKREAQISSNNSSSFIKKIQFNSSSSRQDRSFSDKKDITKMVQSQLGNNNMQENLDQSYQQNYQNQLNKHGTNSQEQSNSQVTQPNSASRKCNISSFQNNTLPGEISLNDSIEFVNMAKAFSPYSPRYELAIRQKHNQNQNKYQLLERRKTAEGISEKSLKFKNNINTSITQTKQKQISISMAGSNSFRQTYIQQKKRESSNSTSKNPQISQSIVHGVQIKKFQLQPDSQNQPNQNSSFENLKLEQKYDSQKTGYSLKDKRYSQQDQFSKQVINEKRNAVNASSQAIPSKNNPYNLLSKSTYEHPLNENNSSLFPNQTPKFTNLEHKNYISSKNSNNNNNGFSQIQNSTFSNNITSNSPNIANQTNTPQQLNSQFSNTPTSSNQNGTQKKIVSLHNKSLISKSLSINNNK